jgi:hypothetical protein
MQLPNNTVPSESNFLAPFFPGAGLSSADAETLTSVGVSPGKGKFDQLFDGLRPSPKPAGPQSPAELATLGFVACPTPFVPVAPAGELAAIAESDLGEPDATLDGECSSDCELSPSADEATGKATGHTTRDERVAARLAKATATAEESGQGTTPDEANGRSKAAHSVNLPNAHASETALQTPRFTGLPANAMEHRQAATVPSGLSRLMAIHSPTSASPVIAAGSTGAEAVSNESDPATDDIPIEGQVSTFGLRPTNWPGASGRNRTNPFPTPVAGRDGDESDATDLTEASALPDEANAASWARNAFPSGHAFGRDAGLASHHPGRSHGRAESEAADVTTVGIDASERMSAGVADVLNRVSAKRDVSNGARMTAKIADALQGGSETTKSALDKSFLASAKEQVASARKHVGTDVAKPAADMFYRFLPTSTQPSASDHAGSVVAALENTPDVALRGETVPVEPVSTAHEAVEVVLKAVEQAASQDQKSVNLRFSVGELDLSVRVELHANQVRTTFRTDSPELRAALSQEWEAVAANPGERTIKMVPAFVTASEHSALNSFSGDTSSRQRDQRAERETNERAGRVTSKSRGAATPTAVAASNAGLAGIAPLTSRRLHTVA